MRIGMAVIIVLAIPTAALASEVPDTTSEFVSFCGQHRKDCYNRLLKVDIGESLRILFATPTPPPRYCIPKEKWTEDYLSDVLTWLSAHPETANLATDDAIVEALSAVFPCG